MRAAEICTRAGEFVGGERQTTHGDMLRCFFNIANIWNAIIAAKCQKLELEVVRPLDGRDVANMMEALKIARRYTGAFNLDDYIDAAGYAGCAAEIAQRLGEK